MSHPDTHHPETHRPDTTGAAEHVADESSAEGLAPAAPERVELPPLQSLNVLAAFDDAEAARGGIVALERRGIEANTVSVLALDTEDAVEVGSESTRVTTVDKDTAMLKDIGSDAAKGAAIGGIAGALGSTAIALAIPGVGAAIGAGILAVTAGGAFAGTSVGGFAGAVSSTPANEAWEQAFVELRNGRVVVGVHTDDRDLFESATEVLQDAGPAAVHQIDQHGGTLR